MVSHVLYNDYSANVYVDADATKLAKDWTGSLLVSNRWRVPQAKCDSFLGLSSLIREIMGKTAEDESYTKLVRRPTLYST